jgi:hypothetical protein
MREADQLFGVILWGKGEAVKAVESARVIYRINSDDSGLYFRPETPFMMIQRQSLRKTHADRPIPFQRMEP